MKDAAAIVGIAQSEYTKWGGLTRFASSAIHQSNWREDTGVRVRVISENRVGVVAANDFSPEGARLAAKSAAEMARVSTPDPLFPGLAPPAPVPESANFDEATGRVIGALFGRAAIEATAIKIRGPSWSPFSRSSGVTASACAKRRGFSKNAAVSRRVRQ